ncbi:MAG: lysylphosphatidylglycerol synthase transmembrane domain-containing protein [Cryomorphaceae bacterium]
MTAIANMKKWFKYFIYISLLFLIIALVKTDSFVIPEILYPKYLFLSVGFLFVGFLLDAVAWGATLKVYGFSTIKQSDAIAGMGLSVFGKYIPGKVWILLGRSAYMAKRNLISEGESAAISLNAQFISLWVGLVLGMASILIYSNDIVLLIFALGLLALLSFLLFFGYAHSLFTFLAKKVFKRDVQISRLSGKQTLRVMPYFIINWLLWCAGFYLLLQSLSTTSFTPLLGLNFSLAATLGVAVVIAPGGIGVREGILASLLVLGGVDLTLATGAAVLSRLWFLAGEIFIFFIGVIIDRHNRKNTSSEDKNMT